MDHVGLLIFFSLFAAFVCARGRHPGGVALFSVLALVLFVSTPVGSGLPGAVSGLLNAVNSASTPALTHQPVTAGVTR